MNRENWGFYYKRLKSQTFSLEFLSFSIFRIINSIGILQFYWDCLLIEINCRENLKFSLNFKSFQGCGWLGKVQENVVQSNWGVEVHRERVCGCDCGCLKKPSHQQTRPKRKKKRKSNKIKFKPMKSRNMKSTHHSQIILLGPSPPSNRNPNIFQKKNFCKKIILATQKNIKSFDLKNAVKMFVNSIEFSFFWSEEN